VNTVNICQLFPCFWLLVATLCFVMLLCCHVYLPLKVNGMMSFSLLLQACCKPEWLIKSHFPSHITSHWCCNDRKLASALSGRPWYLTSGLWFSHDPSGLCSIIFAQHKATVVSPRLIIQRSPVCHIVNDCPRTQICRVLCCPHMADNISVNWPLLYINCYS